MHKKVTPVPIPNTVVKLLVVDDTGAISAGKVDWSHQYNSLLIIHIYIYYYNKETKPWLYKPFIYGEFDPGSG